MDRASVSSLFDVVTINRTPNFLYVGRPSTIETKFVKIGVLVSRDQAAADAEMKNAFC
jgi:hypothetical protein